MTEPLKLDDQNAFITELKSRALGQLMSMHSWMRREAEATDDQDRAHMHSLVSYCSGALGIYITIISDITGESLGDLYREVYIAYDAATGAMPI